MNYEYLTEDEELNIDLLMRMAHNTQDNISDEIHVDMVNHPPHYQSDNGIECIDAIQAALGIDGFKAYCRGNAMKYIWREKYDPKQDAEKAIWYLERYVESCDGN